MLLNHVIRPQQQRRRDADGVGGPNVHQIRGPQVSDGKHGVRVSFSQRASNRVLSHDQVFAKMLEQS